MSYIQVESQPFCEPVSRQDAKTFARIYHAAEDSLVDILLQAAREYCESFTRRTFINTSFVQVFDSFPYFVDTVMSQMAYPPSYYALPRYSTTLWNYSQMMKLFYSRLAAGTVPTIKYVGTDGAPHTLTGTLDSSDQGADFWADQISEPPRLFPKVGQTWPACLYHGNAVEVHYIAGYNDEAAIKTAVDAYKARSLAPSDADVTTYEGTLRRADVPAGVKAAILQLVSHWYEHREAVTSENLTNAPKTVDLLLWNLRVLDAAPTRG